MRSRKRGEDLRSRGTSGKVLRISSTTRSRDFYGAYQTGTARAWGHLPSRGKCRPSVPGARCSLICGYTHINISERSHARTRSPSNGAEASPGLWSTAFARGIHSSGQVARPLEGGKTLVGGNEYEQTKQIFTRIKSICEGAGGSLDDIVKITIFMVNIKNNTEVWRARREFFSGDFPASTLVEVRSLSGPETLVEIETVAYLA